MPSPPVKMSEKEDQESQKSEGSIRHLIIGILFIVVAALAISNIPF